MHLASCVDEHDALFPIHILDGLQAQDETGILGVHDHHLATPQSAHYVYRVEIIWLQACIAGGDW